MSEKIEARLRLEIERLERTQAGERTLSVIVEPRAGTATGGDLDDQARQAQAATEPLRRRLAGMGVVDVQQMVLAAAIVADLTPRQIRELAGDEAVKRITWNAVEKVTL